VFLFLHSGSIGHQPTINPMATQSKTQLLNEVHTLLKRRYKPKADRNPARLSVLKAVVYGICHEDTTREQANQALSRFKDEFFDWNEIRVSSVDEIRESLAGIPEPEERATRIRRFLRQLFNRTYGFTLDALAKKPLKEALKVLHTYDAFESDYVTATVIQQALGGHAIPIDKAALRVLQRLGFTETKPAVLRSLLERAIPKNRGAEFLELIEDLANDTCLQDAPECPRCELRKQCVFALGRKHTPAPAVPAGRTPSAGKAKKAAKTSKLKPTAKTASNPTTKRPAPNASKGTPRGSRSTRGERGRK
jgi:endonuclease-3